MRECVADIHNSATKIKLVLKNESFSFLDIARFEDKLETEWKHDTYVEIVKHAKKSR